MAEPNQQPATSGKSCSSCGVNLDAKPNHKIGSGKYLCPDCMEKAKAAKFAMNAKNAPAAAAKAKATAPADDNSFLLGIGSKTGIAEVGTKPCPECGRALTADAVICTGCGFNTDSGKRTRVKILKPEKAEADGMPKPAVPLHQNPPAVGIAIALLLVGGAIGSIYEPDVTLPLAIGINIFGFLLWIKVVKLVMEDKGGLIGLLFCFIPFYTVYFTYFKQSGEMLKWLTGAMLIGSITFSSIASATAAAPATPAPNLTTPARN